VRLLAAAVGLASGRWALAAVRRAAPLERANYRGRRVSLAGGPAVALAASVGAVTGAAARRDLAGACALAGLGAGAVGLYDDVIGARQAPARGLRGHVGALREGRVTTGLVKVVGLTATALAAAALLPSRRGGRAYRAVDVALGAGVIAGTANLVNLLDRRPGRALKATLLLAAPLTAMLDDSRGPGSPDHPRSARRGVAAGVVGAAVALLPDDLGERVMIGDTGANGLGALVGLAVVARRGPAGRAALLAGLVALTGASERVSFTSVIDATPGLRAFDRLGRRP